MFDLFNQRARDIEAASSGLDLQFSLADPFGCERAPFPLLRRGDSRLVERVLWRDGDPHSTKVFEYRFERVFGDERMRSPWYTCATLLVNASWPYTSISPASVVSDLTGLFETHERVEVESDAFNEAFDCESTDQRFCTALLDAGMQEFLLDKARALTIEVNGAWVMFSADDVPSELVPALFGFTADFLSHVPAVAAELYPGPRPGGIDQPLPDPAVLLSAVRTATDDALDTFESRDPSGKARLADSVLGLSPRAPRFAHFLGYAAAQQAVESAINAEIMDDPGWEGVDASPFLRPEGADDEPEGPEYDLEGHVVQPHEEDPWGPGRPVEH